MAYSRPEAIGLGTGWGILALGTVGNRAVGWRTETPYGTDIETFAGDAQVDMDWHPSRSLHHNLHYAGALELLNE